MSHNSRNKAKERRALEKQITIGREMRHDYIMPHPVWVKPGNVQPRNQQSKPNTVNNVSAISADRANSYSHKMKNDLNARSVVDILNEIRLLDLKRALIRGR